MADHSVFSTAGRTPSAQMDADLAHFTHRKRLPRLWTKVFGERVSAARSTSFGLRPVSTTSAWPFVERPILAQSCPIRRGGVWPLRPEESHAARAHKRRLIPDRQWTDRRPGVLIEAGLILRQVFDRVYRILF
ncbi:hypothetical protein V1277_004657 [Bradyrhizobium sp. AZCC 1588]|uniref:hypothetical protein n=1 Tax=Bradyrhizobium sp. AZCC 1588 TaxID=3117018 RepID=UPI002FF377A5